MERFLLNPLVIASTLLLASAPSVFSQELATVVRVIDGDTVELADGRYIRLQGIDAPELTQPYGDKAAKFLKLCVLNRTVELRNAQSAAWSRTSAQLVWDGVDVNGAMVSNGCAWVDTRYPHRAAWQDFQKSVERRRTGLWNGTQVPPWEWRKGVRSIMPTTSVSGTWIDGEFCPT